MEALSSIDSYGSHRELQIDWIMSLGLCERRRVVKGGAAVQAFASRGDRAAFTAGAGFVGRCESSIETAVGEIELLHAIEQLAIGDAEAFLKDRPHRGTGKRERFESIAQFIRFAPSDVLGASGFLIGVGDLPLL